MSLRKARYRVTIATRKLAPRRRKPIPPAMLEQFKCPRFNTRLSRATCGLMHKKAQSQCKPGTDAICTAEIARCKRCDIGAAHAKGKVADGVEVVTIEARPSGQAGKRRLMAWQDPMPLAERGRRASRKGW